MKHLCLSLLLSLLCLPARATWVTFQTLQNTGSTNYRTVLITPLDGPTAVGTNLVNGPTIKIVPTNGVMPMAWLIPGNYSVSWEGMTGSVKIPVPDTNVVVSAASLVSYRPTLANLTQYLTIDLGDARYSGNLGEMLTHPPNIGAQTTPAFTNLNSGFAVIGGTNTSGVVRLLWVQCSLNAALLKPQLTNVCLQLFADAGTNTFTAARTFSVPLSDLFGNRYRAATNVYAQSRNSRWMNSQDVSTNSLLEAPIYTLALKLPICFTNGLVARLWNVASNTPSADGAIGWAVEFGSVPAPWSTARLCSADFVGAITFNASNALFSVSGPGVAMGLLNGAADTWEGISDITDTKGPSFLLDGSRVWQALGGDDLFFSTYGFAVGNYVGYDYGATDVYYAADQAHANFEAYRWFHADAWAWATSLQGYVPANPEAVGSYYCHLIYYRY